MAPKIEGVEFFLKKTPNDIKVSSQTPKKSLYVPLILLEFKIYL
jgi:hypothetical protein